MSSIVLKSIKKTAQIASEILYSNVLLGQDL